MQSFWWILHLKRGKWKLILLTGGPASIVWWTSTSIGRRAVLRQNDFTFLKLFLGTSEYWNKMHTNATAYLMEKNSHLFLCLYDFVHKKEQDSQKLNKKRCLHCASVDQNQKYAFDFSFTLVGNSIKSLQWLVNPLQWLHLVVIPVAKQR